MSIKAIIPIDDPSPIAFIDVFEEGDKWVKIRGCESCPTDIIELCCNQCLHLTNEHKCRLHVSYQMKSFWCVTHPNPKIKFSDCNLVFECVEGSNKGMIRKLSDNVGILIDKTTYLAEITP